MGVNIPWASLIIPTYGAAGVDLVRRCVTSFRATHPHTDPEIFVVSDGDTPDVQQALDVACTELHARLLAVERGGFAKACNAGLRAASGQVCYLVNNDVEFIEPALLKMYNAADVLQCGVIGCLLLYPDRTIQHAGVVYVPRENAPGYFDHRLRGAHAEHPAALSIFPSLVTGALLGLTRWFIETVGYLDERFGFAVEDIDACLSCLEAGRESMYFGMAQAIHHEGKTRGRTPEEKQARFPELVDRENAALAALQAKWVGLDWRAFK